MKKHFEQTGVDIASAKSLFNAINEHFRYSTLNSWNGLSSIANNVKVYNLGLSGDPWIALAYLEADEYETVNCMIHEWEYTHPNYRVGFNGRSGGYLVLYNKDNNGSIVPTEIDGYDNYEEFKEECATYGYKVSDFFRTLRDTWQIIREFDRLCDEIREYVDRCSTCDFKKDAMEECVELFNGDYYEDLQQLGYGELVVDGEGKVDVTELKKTRSLYEAFLRYLNRIEDRTGISHEYDEIKKDRHDENPICVVYFRN